MKRFVKVFFIVTISALLLLIPACDTNQREDNVDPEASNAQDNNNAADEDEGNEEDAEAINADVVSTTISGNDANREIDELRVLTYTDEYVVTKRELCEKFQDLCEEVQDITESTDDAIMLLEETYEEVGDVIIFTKEWMFQCSFLGDKYPKPEGYNLGNYENAIYATLSYQNGADKGYLIRDEADLYREIEEFIELVREDEIDELRVLTCEDEYNEHVITDKALCKKFRDVCEKGWAIKEGGEGIFILNDIYEMVGEIIVISDTWQFQCNFMGDHARLPSGDILDSDNVIYITLAYQNRFETGYFIMDGTDYHKEIEEFIELIRDESNN